MLSRWRTLMEQELPEALAAVRSAGGTTVNSVALLPEAVRGPIRPTDDRFDTVTARRPVLEAAIAGVAANMPGVTIRRGVTVTGLRSDVRTGPPHVTGVLVEGGQTLSADLVVDCTGRRSALGSWLDAIGARHPVEEREDCGFVYYARHFRGKSPDVRTVLVQPHDSVTVLTLPADGDTWSVVLAISNRDHALRCLRDPSTFDRALAQYPLAAHWREGTPISDVDAIAGIEDRYRRLVVDGEPVATGVVVVGDAWACTNPSLGRGASIGLLHTLSLRDVLRDVDPADPDKLVRRFDELTTTVVEPLYRLTLWFDRHRLDEINADAVGEPHRTDDQRWPVAKATLAAALVDPEIARGYASLMQLLTTPTELLAQPGVFDRVIELGAQAPRYPIPGPDRHALLTAIAA
jgi:2-polyprenyl-6-methoxyphenol hydroxylase-like FAD-dependent oxidoreductase